MIIQKNYCLKIELLQLASCYDFSLVAKLFNFKLVKIFTKESYFIMTLYLYWVDQNVCL